MLYSPHVDTSTILPASHETEANLHLITFSRAIAIANFCFTENSLVTPYFSTRHSFNWGDP